MPKITAAALGTLFGLSVHALYKAARADEIPITAAEPFVSFSEMRSFSYLDALMIELTRQLQDDGGIPAAVAAGFVWNAIGHGIDDWSRPGSAGNDHWIAMLRWRNTWFDGPRGSIPVTILGMKEYWSTAHFGGSLQTVQADIAEAIKSYSDDHPDSDAARIVMANVSAADRRLRKRAAEMGIDLD